MTTNKCHYISPNGEQCSDTPENNNLCYWHDSSHIKQEHDLIERLESRARTGVPMIGFQLRKTNLQGIDLVNHENNESYQ